MGVVSATEVKNTSSTSDLYQKNVEKSSLINDTLDKANETIKLKNTTDSYKTINKVNSTSNSKTTNQSQTLKTNILYVNPSANSKKQNGSLEYPYTTIKMAVKKSLNGYTNIIYLSAGNHIIDVNIPIDKTIEIIGESKAKTNITCNSNQGFRIANGANLTLKKLRMQNANYSQGGAILATENSKLIIDNCIFNKNKANNGAVLFTSGGNVKANITNTRFESNTAVRFGALQLGGYNSEYYIKNCIFSNNVLTDTDYSHSTGGAAIYASSFAKVTVNHCTFTNNKAIWGNAILNGNHATITIINSNFTGNVAIKNKESNNRTKGGAIAIGSGYAEIKNCYFANNKADIGGAISINSGESTLIISSIFKSNIAYYEGGAINNYGTLTLKNSTFLGNFATETGGALLDRGINEIMINNCTFKDNKVTTSRNDYKYRLIPQGGAISITGASPEFIIKNSVFNHNNAYYGGAIFSNVNVKWITISNTTFHNNTSCFGGAMIISGETTLTSKNNTFSYNRALRKAGAIQINGTVQGNFINTNFIKNQVTTSNDGDGGAIAVTYYSRLSFNHCNFNGNYANINGGAIYSDSVVVITIASSNITNNSAKFGSVIYLNNSRNYQTSKSQIIFDTSSFISNKGKYSFYSAKTYDSLYNRNIIRTCWFGTNVITNSLSYNFNVSNYDLLTVNLNDKVINTVWTTKSVIITVNRTQQAGKDLILSTYTIKEGGVLRYTDAFLPSRMVYIKENNNKIIQKDLYVYYHLNMSLDRIIILMDSQKITINIVD